MQESHEHSGRGDLKNEADGPNDQFGRGEMMHVNQVGVHESSEGNNDTDRDQLSSRPLIRGRNDEEVQVAALSGLDYSRTTTKKENIRSDLVIVGSGTDDDYSQNSKLLNDADDDHEEDGNVDSADSADVSDSNDNVGSKMERQSTAQQKKFSKKLHYRFQQEIMNKLQSLDKGFLDDKNKRLNSH